MLIIFIAAVIKGSTGFGFGMVAAPAMMIIDPILVPGPLLVLAMLTSFLIALREWRNVDVKGLFVAFSGRVPGTVLAVLTVSAIPLTLYGIIFGVLIFTSVLLSMTRWRFTSSNRNLFIAGLSSGFMGTITSIGAPPIALVYQHKTASVIRSTLAVFFLLGTIFSIIMLFIFDRFSMDHIYISTLFIPPLLLGFKLSNVIISRLNAKIVRFTILAMCGLSSLALIFRSIMELQL
ncbi:MAG: sulfite exporter TauE/SafE family protein [Emcibacter sp.]|nr:sulfite exporter TauE/SafE family protein [Emcibacter sp.]